MESQKFTGSDSPLIQLITSIINANGQPLILCVYDSKLLQNYEIESPWATVELGNNAFYKFFGCKLGEELLHIDSPLLREAVRQSSQLNEEISTIVQCQAKSTFIKISVIVRAFSRNLLICFDTNTIHHESANFKCPNCGSENSKVWGNLAEAIPHFIFTSSKDGEVDFFNSAWFQYTGMKENESMGWKWMECLHPSDLPLQKEAWLESIQTRKPYEVELRLRRFDGNYRWFLLRARPLVGADDATVKWFGTCTDINDRKTVQEEKKKAVEDLARSEEKFRRLFESNIIGIFISSPNGGILQANDAFFKMLGYSKSQIENGSLNFKDLTAKQWHDLYFASIQALMNEGKCDPYETELIKSDGTLVPVLVGGAKLPHEGQAISFVLDITRRKNAELKALEASSAKSFFIANVSHELRTPLNAIVGMMEFLVETELNELQREYVDTVKKSAEQLTCLINDILDFSKIEANKAAFIEVEFSILKIVEDVIEVLGDQANSKRISLLLTTKFKTDNVIGDPGRVRQILMNLVGNAIKFTDKGYVELEVISEETESMVKIKFIIRDTGIGISETDMQKLFKPFSQIDNTSTRKFTGTGLGLCISRELSTRMGGNLEVESQLGKGSVFSCSLAFKKVLDNITIVEEVDCKAIIMISFEFLRKSIESFLSIEWFEAKTPQEALNQLQKWNNTRIYLITESSVKLDFITPDMDNVRAVILGYPSEIIVPTYKNLKAEFVSHPAFKTKLLNAFLKAFNEYTKSLERKGSPNPAVSSEHVILLAEDNALNRVMATKQLEKLGYKCVCAPNGLEVLKLLEESRSKYSLILMDCQMPEMDGITCTEVIRKQEAEKGCKRIPIIALTANAFPDFMQKCLENGMDDFLSKPVNLKCLKTKIFKWITKPRCLSSE